MDRRTLLAGAAGLALGAGMQTQAHAAPAAPAVWPDPDWQLATPASQRMSEAGLSALEAYLQQTGTHAALVVRNGYVVSEWFWGDVNGDTQFPVYSCTKSFAATAVGFLEAEGKLRLNQPASDFIPEWKTDNHKDVLIRHILTMSSGMSKDEATMYKSDDKVGFALKQKLDVPPGTKWDYNNIGCASISAVIRAAAGMEMSAYLRGKLYQPLGIRHYSHEEPAGHTLPYSGLQITARDMARFGYLYLNAGVWKSHQVLPSSFVGAASTTSQELNRGYGYLFWVNTAGQWPDVTRTAYAARGAYGNELLIVPEKNLLVVRLVGTKPNAGVDMNKMGALAESACTG